MSVELGHTMTRASRSIGRFGALWLLACSVPPLSMVVSIMVNVDASAWPSISMPLVRALAADARLYCAGFITIAAPLAGVAVAWSRKSPGVKAHHGLSRGAGSEALATARPLVVAVVLFTAVSALLNLSLADAPGAAELTATSHATLAAVALALAVFGAFCGAAFADPLDGAACSLGLVLLASAGVLVAGASLELVPPRFIDLALTASPLVAMTSAARIDILRMDVLYQISPLAHVQVDYPTWYAASGWFLVVAFSCFLGLVWTCGVTRTAAAR